jgi:hypothetical protein
MSDQPPDQLDRLLDSYDEKLRRQSEAQAATAVREDRFLAEFSKVRTQTASPFFERIGNRLRSRGHDFEIASQDHKVDQDGKSTDASIGLYVYPSGIDRLRYRHHDVPSLLVIASRRDQKITLRACNMIPGKAGTAGSVGEFTLDQLTQEILERALMKVLMEALGG